MRVPALLFSSCSNKRLAKPVVFTLCLIRWAKCNLNKRGIEVDINYTCELIKHYYDRFFRKAIFIVWYLTCSWLWAFRCGELWAVLSRCIQATHTHKGSKFIPSTGTKLQTRITQDHSLSALSLRHSLCSSVSTVTSLRDTGPTNLGSIFGRNRDSAPLQSVWIFSGNSLSLLANAKRGFFLWR